MIVTTVKKNKYDATVKQEENIVNVAVGNIHNENRVPGKVLEYGVRSINGMSGDIVIDTAALSGAVSFISEQNLTPEQQQRARTNIGIESATPTKISQLENDSNFIIAQQAPVQSINGQVGDIIISEGGNTLTLYANKTLTTLYFDAQFTEELNSDHYNYDISAAYEALQSYDSIKIIENPDSSTYRTLVATCVDYDPVEYGIEITVWRGQRMGSYSIY